MSTVARFHIEHVRLIDTEGEALAPLPAFARDPAALVPLYRAMYLTRTFDAKAIALQRTGKLGTFARRSARRRSASASPRRWTPRTCCCRPTANMRPSSCAA